MENEKLMIKANINLSKIKNVIFIASGKGGVGKSFVTSNLAISLARKSYKVGVFDADLYGPSMAKSFGIENLKLETKNVKDNVNYIPFIKNRIKVMSISNMLSKDQALIWRGPMVSKSLLDLLENTLWQSLDYLLIDLPPGTGDIAITLCQKFPNAKSIIITTPQQMSFVDALRAGKMFESLDIKMLGIIENMSFFVPQQHPEEQYYIFGRGGGINLASKLNIDLIEKIPLSTNICENIDQGHSIYESNNSLLKTLFDNIAKVIDGRKNDH